MKKILLFLIIAAGFIPFRGWGQARPYILAADSMRFSNFASTGTHLAIEGDVFLKKFAAAGDSALAIGANGKVYRVKINSDTTYRDSTINTKLTAADTTGKWQDQGKYQVSTQLIDSILITKYSDSTERRDTIHGADINYITQIFYTLIRGRDSLFKDSVYLYKDVPSGPLNMHMAYDSVSGKDTLHYSLTLATTSTNGYLSSTDWNTFNNKEPALGNPASDGYLLSSTTGGGRSWVAQSGGSNIGNTGTGYALSTGTNIKRLGTGINILADSITTSNTITVHADTTAGNTHLATQGDIINAAADGSETKLNAGIDVTTSGTGTTGSPYVVNADTTAGNTKLATQGDIINDRVNPIAGNGVGITGSYPNFTFKADTSVVATINYVTNHSGGGGSPAGSDREIQFNNSGAFGASSTFKYFSAPALSSSLARGLIVSPALPAITANTDTTIALDINPTWGSAGAFTAHTRIGLRVLGAPITNSNDYSNSSSLVGGGGLTIVEGTSGVANQNRLIGLFKSVNTGTGGLVVQLASGTSQNLLSLYNGAASEFSVTSGGNVSANGYVNSVAGPVYVGNFSSSIQHSGGLVFNAGGLNAGKIFQTSGNFVLQSTTQTDVVASKLTVTTTTQGSLPAPRVTQTQRNAIAVNGINGGNITGGSAYTNGTFAGTSLTNVRGSGTGAVATIIVAGGVVTTVSITSVGSGYAIGDILTASLAGGTGFQYQVYLMYPGGAAGLQVFNTDTENDNYFNGWNWTGDLVTTSAATLDLYNGRDYVFTGTTTTWTLPPVTVTNAVSTPTGRRNMITIKNRGSGAITLNSLSGSTIYTNAAVSTLTINAGEAYVLMPDGTYFNVE